MINRFEWQNFLSYSGEKNEPCVCLFFSSSIAIKKCVSQKSRDKKNMRKEKKIILCAFLSSFNATNEDIISLELKLRVFPMSVRIRA